MGTEGKHSAHALSPLAHPMEPKAVALFTGIEAPPIITKIEPYAPGIRLKMHPEVLRVSMPHRVGEGLEREIALFRRQETARRLYQSEDPFATRKSLSV